MEPSKILVTGGSGLLGSKLKELLPDALYPTHDEMDISMISDISWFITEHKNIEMVVHLAAFTSPPKIDADPWTALSSNIKGTANIVDLCMGRDIYLIYMSTDYVFDGEEWYDRWNGGQSGEYDEGHYLNPVNKYAWSKLGGECAVRMYDNSLIVRTSFGPDIFPYDKAFVDQYTSRESVTNIAHKLVRIINYKPYITGVLHIGGKCQTVYDYAKKTKPDVGKLKTSDVSFKIPHNTSLDTTRYEQLFWGKND
jgi:dTDP-4-dehydrorhamnose reductase